MFVCSARGDPVPYEVRKSQLKTGLSLMWQNVIYVANILTQTFHTHFTTWLMWRCYKLIFVPKHSSTVCPKAQQVWNDRNSKEGEHWDFTSKEAFVDAAPTRPAFLRWTPAGLCVRTTPSHSLLSGFVICFLLFATLSCKYHHILYRVVKCQEGMKV